MFFFNIKIYFQYLQVSIYIYIYKLLKAVRAFCEFSEENSSAKKNESVELKSIRRYFLIPILGGIGKLLN